MAIAKDFSRSQNRSLILEQAIRPEEFVSLRIGGPPNRFAVSAVIHKQGDALFSREFIFKKGRSLNLGAKYTGTGGRWYGKVDPEASRLAQDVVFEDSDRNSRQFRPYNRFDVKTEYKINRNRLTHTLAVDLVNVLGIQNLLGLSYTPETPYFRQEYQLGFLPVFFYRVDF